MGYERKQPAREINYVPPPRDVLAWGVCTRKNTPSFEKMVPTLAVAFCMKCPVRAECLNWCLSPRNTRDPCEGTVAGGFESWERVAMRNNVGLS